MMPKKSQQEIAGFVLIVTIVMIAGIVFLVISARRDTNEVSSNDLDNFLISIMGYTTDCVATSAPNYYTFSKLVSGCYNQESCSNLNNQETCVHLNETITKIIGDFIKTRNDITAYRFEILYNSSTELRPLITAIDYGSCTKSKVYSAQEKIKSGDTDLIVIIKICKELRE